MRKGLTELVFLLDMSGSMYPLTEDTIGGFNAMLEEQKKKQGDALVTTVLFNIGQTMIHDRVPVGEVEKMTPEQYRACGCTALVDALGSTVQHISNVHKYIREEDIPEHTMFVVSTDGAENASSIYTAAEVKEMVKTSKEERGWEFIFLGANIDAIETASFLGIDSNRAAGFRCDREGIKAHFAALGIACSSCRDGAGPGDDWKALL